MNKKIGILFSLLAAAILVGCGSNSQNTGDSHNAQLKEPNEKNGATGVDESKGKGKFTEIKLNSPLDQGMIATGKSITDVKCVACHKLTDEKLVGPGWKGVTTRRKPEWIMNFVTNTDEMIDKDAAAQALLEKCMVRMPNQHLSDEEARSVLEYMFKLDGKK